MNTSNARVWGLFAIVASAAMWGSTASAASVTVSCPNTIVTTDREFSVTTDPGTVNCYAYGDGQGLNGAATDVVRTLLGPGYVTLDSTEDTTTGLLNGALSVTGIGGSSGTFWFSAPLYMNFVVGFQNNHRYANPDWAAFNMFPAGTCTAAKPCSWAIAPVTASPQLMRAVLYAMPVPLPPAAWLLLSGLAFLGVLKRRKTA